MNSTNNKLVHVTITSDLMCPWCWIGLKKLEQASKESKIDVNITWKPFLLRPNIPMEGTPKGGGTPSSRVGVHLRHSGESVGINFTGLTDRTPNTTLFHATLKYLQDEMKIDSKIVTEFHEAVFEAYFTLGIYPDEKGILNAAQKVKDETVYSHIKNLLYSTNLSKKLNFLLDKVAEEALDASRMGVSGVPSFAFNGNMAFSGAQPVETFVKYLTHYSSR